MGKTKQVKEKKFDRNVEISAPILDPEVIRKIHSPPEDQRLDMRHGGFKALLSDLNSQDSTDEVTPIMETNHLPSYIGISCAVSGYSNYSAYNKKPLEDISNSRIVATKQTKVTSSNKQTRMSSTPNRSQTNSPAPNRIEIQNINHITIDRSHINSADEELREFTDKMTASASDRRRSPSPLPPVENERHHGAYVGARYCPMPPPDKLVHKHIPLLGIDDDQDPDEFEVEDVNKVEEKIATLYGDEFVEDWKESMSHKAKKEHFEDEQQRQSKSTEASKKPKDLVTLKPTPTKAPEPYDAGKQSIDVPTPNIKVLAGVEKQFLNRLLTDENPPMPKSPSPQPTSPVARVTRQAGIEDENVELSKPKASETPIHTKSPISQSPISRESPISPDSQQPVESNRASPSPISPEPELNLMGSPEEEIIDLQSDVVSQPQHDSIMEQMRNNAIQNSFNSTNDDTIQHYSEEKLESVQREDSPAFHQESQSPQPMSLAVDNSQSIIDEATDFGSQLDSDAGHIEYAIRTQSPVDNQSSPVKVDGLQVGGEIGNLVSFSPEPSLENQNELVKSSDELVEPIVEQEQKQVVEEQTTNDLVDLVTDNKATIQDSDKQAEAPDGNNSDGHYYLNLLEQEEGFIKGQIELTEATLAARESEFDEDTLGRLRSAIGKANLLINKKCNQFRELCERGINHEANDQFAVLNDDLAGFWDMLSIQISDVRKSFESLNNNNK